MTFLEKLRSIQFSVPAPVKSLSAGKEFTSRRALERHMKENGIVNRQDFSESPIVQMERDRVMTRMIREGKGSDRGIKREAEIIQREHENKRKRAYKEKDQRELKELKRKYGIK